MIYIFRCLTLFFYLCLKVPHVRVQGLELIRKFVQFKSRLLHVIVSCEGDGRFPLLFFFYLGDNLIIHFSDSSQAVHNPWPAVHMVSRFFLAMHPRTAVYVASQFARKISVDSRTNGQVIHVMIHVFFILFLFVYAAL